MTIFLIGMPGCGKTTIGKLLAESLQISFFDTDTIISSLEEMTISEIFVRHGEAYFRKLETDLLSNWKLHNAVIATGGGLPCHDNLIERINEIGTSVWLKVPVAILEQRLNMEATTRPLIENKDNVTKWLKESLRLRSPFYRDAKIRMNGNEHPDIITKRILRQLYT
ncbi:MAG TPA: shikimate kinase [Saprospiraceae bacterium]|nr:shikimate kinase [Saprospiraceae bacterium]